MEIIGQIALAIIWVLFLEWAIHRFVLHGLGKKKGSIFDFHWRVHHRKSRRNGFKDDDYIRLGGSWKEILGILVVGLAHLPLASIFPMFYATMWIMGLLYYHVHAYSHKDPEWAKQWVPWHYSHHMGRNQNSNYGVLSPWFDKLFGTYEDPND